MLYDDDLKPKDIIYNGDLKKKDEDISPHMMDEVRMKMHEVRARMEG